MPDSNYMAALWSLAYLGALTTASAAKGIRMGEGFCLLVERSGGKQAGHPAVRACPRDDTGVGRGVPVHG